MSLDASKVIRICLVLSNLAVGACSSTTPETGTAPSSDAGSKRQVCPSKCTAAESDAYDRCVVEKCGTGYAACYGNDWASGNYGGPCGERTTCTNACPCFDGACQAKCPPMTQQCEKCVLNLDCSACDALICETER